MLVIVAALTAALTQPQGVARTSRRAAFAGLCMIPTIAAPALAFENGVAEMAQFQENAKKPGSPPPDLGQRDRVLLRGDRLEQARANDDQNPRFRSQSRALYRSSK